MSSNIQVINKNWEPENVLQPSLTSGRLQRCMESIVAQI